jgi:hypothetical protein
MRAHTVAAGGPPTQTDSDACFHCGQRIAGASWRTTIAAQPREFCCAGCASVAQTLEAIDASTLYASRTSTRFARPSPDARLDEATSAAVAAASVRKLDSTRREAALLIDGRRCGACAALIERWIARLPDVESFRVNYATSRYQERPTALGRVTARLWRPRIVIYATLLVTVVAAVVATLILRVPLKVNVLRDRASLVRDAGGGRLENVYQLQIINAAEQPRSFAVEASGLAGVRVVLDGDNPVTVPAAATQLVPVRLQIDPTGLAPGSHPVMFHVRASDDAQVKVDEKSVFFSR